MILSFGEMLVDMINEGGSYTPYPGGAPANFAVGVSRLGYGSRLVGSVGNDTFGKFLLSRLDTEGVETAFVKQSCRKTTLAFVDLVKGNPTFSFYRDADYHITPGSIKPNMLKYVKHVHFSGFSLASTPIRDALFKLLEYAKHRKIPISMSLNTRPDIWSKSLDRHLRRAMNFSNTIFASRKEIKQLPWSSFAEELVYKHSLDRLVITDGRNGSSMCTPKNRTKMPAFRVSSLDTTGSGDAYAAAMVCGLRDGLEGKDLMRFATAAAAISVTKKGAMSALPRKREVLDFLDRNS